MLTTPNPQAPQGAIPLIGIPDSKDIPRLVYTAPYFVQSPLAELLEPAVQEAVEAMLPALVPPYVDGAASAAVQELAVLLTGSSMSGPLMLSPLMPTADTMAATKAYVDTMIATAGVPEVPAVPVGQTWAREVGQWVPITEETGVFLPITGGMMQGQINMSGNAITNLPAVPVMPNGAAPAQWVLQQISSVSLYQGVWNLDTMVPDLTAPSTHINGYTWIATTSTAGVVIGPAVPGLQGKTVFNGDHVIFSAAQGTFSAMHSGGLTLPEADARYLQLVGGQMSGALLLNANATAPTQAVTLQQLTAAVAGAGLPEAPTDGQVYGRNGVTHAWAPALPLVGGVLSGQLTLAGNATLALQAVPKQQLDATLATAVSGYLPITGGVAMTGLFSLSGNAGSNLNPVPLQQVNAMLNSSTATAEAYNHAQHTMMGGGTISWGGVGGRLKWTSRFLCVPVGGGAGPGGYLQMDQPVTDIPAGNVYDGVARSATAAGVILNAYEGLFFAHTTGGTTGSFFIAGLTPVSTVPSNWILIASATGDGGACKLGTGEFIQPGKTITGGDQYISKTGDTMSGPLTVNAAGPLYLITGAGTSNNIQFYDGGTLKFEMGKTATNSFALFDAVNGAAPFITNPAGAVSIGESQQIQIPKTGPVGFGGTTAAFPALKPSGTTLQVRLADDSALAPLAAASVTAAGNSTFGGAVKVQAEVAAANFVIADQLTTNAGAFGFTNANGPRIVTYGSGTGTPSTIVMDAPSGTMRLTVAPGGITCYTSILPSATNTFTCGHPSLAWNVVHSYAFTNASDPSLKRDIAQPPPGALAHVQEIAAATYKWKDDAAADAPTHWGFLATDVQAAMGEDFGGVVEDKESGLKGINYHEMVSVLWAAVQELSAKVQTLEAAAPAAQRRAK